MSDFVNAYERNGTIHAFEQGGQQVQLAGKNTAFFKTCDLSTIAPVIAAHDSQIANVEYGPTWIRIDFLDGHYERNTINPKTGRPGLWVRYREKFCKHLETHGIKTFEGDVSPIRRWMLDETVTVGHPRRAYLDIETDSRETFATALNGGARMLCWALVYEDGFSQHGLLTKDAGSAEQDLFHELWDALAEIDQIVAWNGDGFDFPVLEKRSAAIGAQCPDWKRLLKLDHLKVFKTYNISSAEDAEEKTSYKLDHIAKSLLGTGKDPVDGSKAWEYWAAGGQQRQDLLMYCIQDTDLLRRIESKTGYLETFQIACETTNVFPDSNGLKPTRFVDGYMLQLATMNDHHWPSHWYDVDVKDAKFKGAVVFDNKTSGVTKDVHVCDFASLYPSVMITWNISPETKVDATYTGAATVTPFNGVRFRTDSPGLLPTALRSLMELRKHWKKVRAGLPPGTPESKQAEYRTNVYKMIANSFYGVMGNVYSRYFDVDVAECTTQNGVALITEVANQAMLVDYKMLYGDTDSAFIAGGTADEFRAFVAKMNSEYTPAFVTKLGCVDNAIKLEYEKQFSRLVISGRKKYMGTFAHYNGTAATANSKPEIKGLEVKRGDSNKLARKLMYKIIDMFVCDVTDYATFKTVVKDFKELVLTGSLDIDEVAISKSISRPLNEYTARGAKGTLPVHVTLATNMKKAGESVAVGTRIKYVVVDGTTSPLSVKLVSSGWDGVFDRHHLWETLVYPPTERLLTAMFPDTQWDQFAHSRSSRKYDPRQLSLFGDS